MAVTTTPITHDALRAAKQYHGTSATGLTTDRVGGRGLEAMIAARLDNLPAGASMPQLYKGNVTLADSTAQIVVSSAGVLYGIRVVHGENVTGLADVIVRVSMSDDNRIVLACLSGFEEATEAYCFGGDGNVGVSFITSLRVRALLASDGTSAAATVNRPRVELYYSV